MFFWWGGGTHSPAWCTSDFSLKRVWINPAWPRSHTHDSNFVWRPDERSEPVSFRDPAEPEDRRRARTLLHPPQIEIQDGGHGTLFSPGSARLSTPSAFPFLRFDQPIISYATGMAAPVSSPPSCPNKGTQRKGF